MPTELKSLKLDGVDLNVETFILSRSSESRPYLISAVFECLRERAPMNEAEILGRCRRIRYAARAKR